MPPAKRPVKTVALDEATHALLSEFREKDETMAEAVRRALERARNAPQAMAAH
jgi:hypothetical protein